MNLSAMLSNHPFWGVLTLAVLIWYSTITVYVAIRGVVDIRHMLRNLQKTSGAPETLAPDDDRNGARLR